MCLSFNLNSFSVDCNIVFLDLKNAERNQRDQGFSVDRPEEGRKVGENQEKQGKYQIQGTSTVFFSTSHPEPNLCTDGAGHNDSSSPIRTKYQF